MQTNSVFAGRKGSLFITDSPGQILLTYNINALTVRSYYAHVYLSKHLRWSAYSWDRVHYFNTQVGLSRTDSLEIALELAVRGGQDLP